MKFEFAAYEFQISQMNYGIFNFNSFSENWYAKTIHITMTFMTHKPGTGDKTCRKIPLSRILDMKWWYNFEYEHFIYEMINKLYIWNWKFTCETQISHTNHGIYQLICENTCLEYNSCRYKIIFDNDCSLTWNVFVKFLISYVAYIQPSFSWSNELFSSLWLEHSWHFVFWQIWNDWHLQFSRQRPRQSAIFPLLMSKVASRQDLPHALSFLLLWRIGVDCRSMMHLHETLWSKLWPLDYEIETCMFRFYIRIGHACTCLCTYYILHGTLYI